MDQSIHRKIKNVRSEYHAMVWANSTETARWKLADVLFAQGPFMAELRAQWEGLKHGR